MFINQKAQHLSDQLKEHSLVLEKTGRGCHSFIPIFINLIIITIIIFWSSTWISWQHLYIFINTYK